MCTAAKTRNFVQEVAIRRSRARVGWPGGSAERTVQGPGRLSGRGQLAELGVRFLAMPFSVVDDLAREAIGGESAGYTHNDAEEDVGWVMHTQVEARERHDCGHAIRKDAHPDFVPESEHERRRCGECAARVTRREREASWQLDERCSERRFRYKRAGTLNEGLDVEVRYGEFEHDGQNDGQTHNAVFLREQQRHRNGEPKEASISERGDERHDRVQSWIGERVVYGVKDGEVGVGDGFEHEGHYNRACFRMRARGTSVSRDWTKVRGLLHSERARQAELFRLGVMVLEPMYVHGAERGADESD